ncbi:hypothetical protein BO70DRAFT_360708 [Aspergillus heteromorphus CBS 117.55]|uniref:Uncharacterized protein n=1 Tax=Aspergillus heteromorphus CBS 117.55 TaxID=1448321 RepID=A0A317WLS0_9EURO|nr:uncharacterized protein BO70DRAFT_360708 [Aspergillus heteromorphus CBS 117.55]PWY86975.1 hypothetical protein BO70DRAFT_360708 [Aspergillus heteromorphus CBS 117.55]
MKRMTEPSVKKKKKRGKKKRKQRTEKEKKKTKALTTSGITEKKWEVAECERKSRKMWEG